MVARRPGALAFDVYGTLIDVSGMGRELRRPRLDGDALAANWRRHQLEISWLLSLLERYEDFATVSGYALDAALAEAGIDLSAEEKAAALAALSELPAYEDAAPALARLAVAGIRLAVLSNGSPAMLDAVLGAAGLGACFDAIVSVDEIGVYKPSPRVYHHAAGRLGLEPHELWLVSANPFDCAGAKCVGLGVVRVERARALSYGFGGMPDLVVRSLTELADALG